MIKPLHQLFPKIEAVSKRKSNRVAIGVLRDSPEVRKALEIGSKQADLVIVGKKKIPGFKTIALGEVSDNDYSKAVIDLLQKGKIDLAINISMPRSDQGETDGFLIRRNCIDLGIPLITNLQAAELLVSALSSKKMSDLQIKSWDEYVS